MINIKFYGHLKRFGNAFQLEVTDTAEAIRALCIQLDGLREGGYKIRIGKQYLTNEAVASQKNCETQPLKMRK